MNAFEWLAHLDLIPGMGVNWFAAMCGVMMILFGFRQAMKMYNPFSLGKTPAIIVSAVFPFMLYYTLLDIFPHFLFTVGLYIGVGVNPAPYVMEFLAGHISVNSLPSNIIATAVFAAIVFLLPVRERISLKALGFVFLFTMVVDACLIMTYSSHNIRLSPDRVLLYYLVFIPSWLFWLFVYTKLYWKKPEVEL